MADHEQHTLSVKEQVALLPSTPGVYQFLNRAGEIIYVGKAKNLKKRVSSYFMESREHAPKIRMMVRQIAALRHIDVPTEQDALLLENSLIKTLQPRYNTMLKERQDLSLDSGAQRALPPCDVHPEAGAGRFAVFRSLLFGDGAEKHARPHSRHLPAPAPVP